jgi:hypothetical protein
VVIDGTIADVFVGSTPFALPETTGPIQIVVTVPSGTTTAHLISDLGFGHGYDLCFVEWPDLVGSDNGLPVLVDVFVPATDDSLRVSVNVAARLLGFLWPAGSDGTANTWVSVDSRV